jgi:hypothetical protein
MPRVRTAKTLSRRIDLQYFTRLHGIRRARLLLSVVVPVLALAWLLGEHAIGNRKVYTSGPLSSSHAVFTAQCSLCHLSQTQFRAHTPDRACLSCHDAPVHNQRQTSTPACSSCHLEHQGRMRLAITADSSCVQCHGSLATNDGNLKVDAHVSGFDDKHPQFAPLRPGYMDPGTIKLNHYVHLQATLRGPSGPVQMKCDDCHRFAMHGPWPYSVQTVELAEQKAVDVAQPLEQQRKRHNVKPSAGAYAIPIRYVNQCAACHVLQFDPLITEPAPHDKPEKVRAFIISKLTGYVAKNPSVLRMPIAAGLPVDGEERRNILRPTEVLQPVNMVPTPEQWVQQRTVVAERLLWSKNCRLCHAQTIEEGDALPSKVTAIIPVRWLPRAEFDHEGHRMMTCTACHSNIPKSRLTSDINLPGIELCRQCHKQAGPRASAAEGLCFECHAYHDWRAEKFTDGKLDVLQLRGHGPAASAINTAPPLQAPPPSQNPNAPSSQSESR